jgi:hypothetical protein
MVRVLVHVCDLTPLTRKLLAPSAKPVHDLAALSTRRLAVDVSIWLIQLIKGARGRDGEMRENAVLHGVWKVRARIFRSCLLTSSRAQRIAKMLFWNIRPILVFEG